ncbi:MAG: tetratricopeptide repeat protein, partial [Novosphingobium sp.]
IRGDSVAGLEAFRQAAATTAEQLARDPDNPQRIFDHAQSVFWVGYIAYERGEYGEAETNWGEYKRLADRLIALNPKKPEWQMELSYADTNLGVLYYDQGRYAEAEPLFAAGVRLVEAVAAGQKHDPGRQLEVGGAVNWLGKARDALNRFDEAEQLHRQEISIYQDILKSDPANNLAKTRLAVAWQHISEITQIKGNLPAAIAAEENSLAIMKQLRAIEPANTEWQETETRAMLDMSDNLYFAGRIDQSAKMTAAASASIDRLVAADKTNSIWSVKLTSWKDWQRGRLALARGKPEEALSIFSAAARRSDSDTGAKAANKSIFEWYIKVGTGDALARLGRRQEASAIWLATLSDLGAEPKVRPIGLMRVQFMLFKRLGRKAEAAAARALLDRQGDRSPAYLREKSF